MNVLTSLCALYLRYTRALMLFQIATQSQVLMDAGARMVNLTSYGLFNIMRDVLYFAGLYVFSIL